MGALVVEEARDLDVRYRQRVDEANADAHIGRVRTFDELRSQAWSCARNRHRLTGDQSKHLCCRYCGPDRPPGRWGAVWAQAEEDACE